ncbi:hypothetical protein PHISP_03678 [Aspergillus sp. HF37]|nr:hypothetical protein PHISP_03678 [Aspergillus sp. HF37]
MTVTGVVVVTVWIFVQLLGLALVTYYIYHLPSWAHSLDALSVARIGASMDRSKLPQLDEGTEVNDLRLVNTNGIIGLRDDVDDNAFIQLGGPGMVTRRHAARKKSSGDSKT